MLLPLVLLLLVFIFYCCLWSWCVRCSFCCFVVVIVVAVDAVNVAAVNFFCCIDLFLQLCKLNQSQFYIDLLVSLVLYNWWTSFDEKNIFLFIFFSKKNENLGRFHQHEHVYSKLLCAKIPKGQKRQSSYQCLFALLLTCTRKNC